MSFKRVLALVLALTMIFSLAMPGSWAFAEEDDGIVAVEDEYNEEGIVEDPVEEVPAITEETPAEEPAAEVIVPDNEPAEEPEETEEEEEELEELLLEDLDTFEAPKPGDVAKVGSYEMGFSTLSDAINAAENNGTGDVITLLQNTSQSANFFGSEIYNITFIKNGTATDIGSVSVNSGNATYKKVTLDGITIVGNLTVESGDVVLKNVTVTGSVTINGGTLTYNSGEVKGAVNVIGGSFIVPTGTDAPTFSTVTASEAAVKRTIENGYFRDINPLSLVAFGYVYAQYRVQADSAAANAVACTVNADGSVEKYYTDFAVAVTEAKGQKTIYLLKDLSYEIPKNTTVKVDGNGHTFTHTTVNQYYVEEATDGITYVSKPAFGRKNGLGTPAGDRSDYIKTFQQGVAYAATNTDAVLRIFYGAVFDDNTVVPLPTNTTLTIVCNNSKAAEQIAGAKERLSAPAGYYIAVSAPVKVNDTDSKYTIQSLFKAAEYHNTPYASFKAAIEAANSASPTDLIKVYANVGTAEDPYRMADNEVRKIQKVSEDLDLFLAARADAAWLYVYPAIATTTDATTYSVKSCNAWIEGVNYFKTLSDAAKVAGGVQTVNVINYVTLDKTEGSGDYIKLTEDLTKVTINKNGNATFDDSLVYTEIAGKAIKKTTVNDTTTYELVDAVAYIGDFVPAHSYPTLEEAIAAATPTDVVYLATDTELTNTADWTDNGAKTGIYNIDKAVTINGNGHTIRIATATDNNHKGHVFNITTPDSVNLQNLVIDGVKQNARAGVHAYTGANVKLVNVTVKNCTVGVIVNASKVEATNLNTSGNEWGGVNVDPNGRNTGATFSINSGILEDNSSIYTEHGSNDNPVTVNITGGSFVGVEAKEEGYEGFNISGGTFKNPVKEEYCAEGYKPVILGNGPLYGVTQEALVLRLVDYPAEGVVKKTGGQGYLATQTDLAINDAIASTDPTKETKVLVVLATDTNFRIKLEADQKICYATADEQYLNFVYPAGYYPVVVTDSKHGVSSKAATLSGAQTFKNNELVESYANTAAELTKGFTAANKNEGMTIKLWQATPDTFTYTMASDTDLSLTLDYAAGVATLTDTIKAPKGFQLHQDGNIYTIGKAIAHVDYYDGTELAGTDYFDNLKDAADEAIKTNMKLIMTGTPTDTAKYTLDATKTLTVVENGFNIQPYLVSGNKAVVKTETPEEGTYTYSVHASVASVDNVYYPTFVSAAKVATKTDSTVVLVATPDKKDKIELTAKNKGAKLTVKDDGYIATITDLLHLLPTETDTQVRTVYIDTANAADGAKTYTLQRYAAVLTDGTGARTYYKAGELNNAIAEYYNNTSWYKYVELLDDGSYTMAKTAADLKVKANGYDFTVRGNEDTVYDIEDSTADGVTTYHVAVYAAKVFETEYKYQNSKAQGEHEWVATGKTETVYKKSLSEAVDTATALATRTGTADVGDIAYDYTITLLATVTDYKLKDGTTLELKKNGFTANITAKTPASYEVIEYPDSTYTSYKKYAITYKLNDGTNSKQNPTYYTIATPTVILHDAEKTGYTFVGWYSDNLFKNKVESIDTSEKKAKTLYAKFDANTFTVKFDANGGLGTMTDLTLTFGDETKSLPALKFVRTGYSFKGWSLSADGIAWALDKNQLNATAVKQLYAKATETDLKVTLYALWKPNTFTVKFDANGGSGTMSDQNFTYGTDTTLTLNTFTSGSGYTGFEGWNTERNGSGTSYTDGAAVGTISETNGATVTLYAQWGAAKFTLRFDGQDASSGTMEDITLTYNLASPTKLPANTFKKDGNEFQGWAYNGTRWGYDSNSLDVNAINDLFAKATGTELTVTLTAMWQPKVAQVGEKFYDKFVEAVGDAVNTDKTLILWATPTDATDVYSVNGTSGAFVVSVKDMRTSPAADKAVNGDLLVINDDPTVYFAESDPVDAVITYTLTKYAARLTDGQGTPKYYTDFDGADETTAAVAAYLKHPGYYKYIEILDAVEYAMPYDLWAKDDLYLPVKVTYGSFTPTAKDDSYSIDTLTAAERKAAGIDTGATNAYSVGANTVTVVFHHVKQVASQTQGKTDWVDDTSADVPVAEYTRYYDSLEKAVAAIRAARTGLNKNTQKVLVTITVSADDTLVLTTANEEYTITFENGASADVTIAKKLEATCVLTTTGEGQTFTYKAFVVNGTDVKFVNQTDKAAPVISTYKATAGTKIINPGDPMNPIDSSIDKYEYKGYYFDKWYKDAEMTEEFDFNAETVPAEGTLTVYGRFLKATYTLTLDFAGGKAPDSWTLGNAIEYSIDSKSFKLPKLTKSGYNFESWEGVAADGSTDTYTEEYLWKPASNTKNWKLTAVWSGAKFTVDFVDSVTQTLIASRVAQEDGVKLDKVPNLAAVNAKIPVKNYPEGKTLVADRLWQGVDVDTVASKDVTVYNLNWLDLYEVKFHANGIDFGSTNVADGDTIPADSIPNIRMTGKTAVWHIGSEDGPVFDILNDVVTGNLELCATFADQRKVTFKVDGEAFLEKLVVDGETVEQPADPEPAEGFDFVGWYLGDAEEAFDFETPITENTTLTAKFAKNADYFKGIVYTASAQLAESINLNLKMANVPAGTSAKDYYVKVSVNGNETENPFENVDATHLKAIAERAYAFQMNDVVDMSVYYVGLEEPIKVITGYSLRQYFENRYRAANTSANEKAMFKAALDYGAAAQLNFNYDVENLANSTVNPENALPTVEKPNSKASREGTIDGITSYKVSLVMDSQVAVKFKVNAANKDDYTFKVDGYDFKVSDAPVNGYYEIDVTGFTPLNLKNNVTLTITKGSELVKLTYSPYTYAANKWASTENNGALANLVKAMVIFGNAVETWNNNKNG